MDNRTLRSGLDLTIAASLVFLTGCYPYLRYHGGPPQTGAETIEALTVATAHDAMKGNRVDILENGERAFPAMLAAIRGARTSVHFETFIFHDGKIGDAFVAALAERAAAGVQVRLLLDAYGSSKFGEENRRLLEAAGARVIFFQPIRLNNVRRVHIRTHRKVLIVDGRLAFTGGICIDDAWQGDAERPDHWRDTQIRVEGPVVRDMQTAFARTWLVATGELLGNLELEARPWPPGGVTAQLLDVSPDRLDNPARLLFLIALDRARTQVDLTTAYFVPDDTLLPALMRAARRGVRVRLLLPGPNNDAPAVRQAARRYYSRLLKAGVEIYEYQPARLHAKVMVVDRLWASVGSANLDRRSLAWNYESNLNLFDGGIATDLSALFEHDLERSRRQTLADWRERPLGDRFKEWLFGHNDGA
jgi:cardiolipin synthase